MISVIFLLGGPWSFIRPVNSFSALASVLGVILIFHGTFEIFRTISMHGVSSFWWIGLITSSLLIQLAFWVPGSGRVYALAQPAPRVLISQAGFFGLLQRLLPGQQPLPLVAASRTAPPNDPGGKSALRPGRGGWVRDPQPGGTRCDRDPSTAWTAAQRPP